MKWVKGMSGNPGGRPKLEVSIRDLAQQNSMEALETLVQVMRTGKPGERLDRGERDPGSGLRQADPIRRDVRRSLDPRRSAGQPEQKPSRQ